MRRGGAMGAIASSPTMVGAITVLIVVVAVFLAYNANTGLPFVPTYRISAQVPNANTLVPSNEVRIGGVRVGLVEDVVPQQRDDGSTSARLDLKLDDEVRELPQDSTVIVRSRSALGLKYLEIKKGRSSRGIPEGAAMPLSRAKPEPVEIDQVLNTFDEPTRLAIQRNLVEFGNAIAARGPDLNEAIGRLAPALRRLQPVARILADPSTRLGRLVEALRNTAAEVAPVAEIQARMFVSLTVALRRDLDELIALVRERGLDEDPLTRDRIARLQIASEALRLGGLRTLTQTMRTGVPGPEGSLAKWQWADANQALTELATEVLGPEGLERNGWSYRFLRARANSIEGGTTEVMKNIIAERVLGLPKLR